MASEWQEDMMNIGGIQMQVSDGGQGGPLLVLHGASGHPGWLRFHAALAQHFHVYAPSHPGFGASDRPDWIDRLSDLAYVYRWFLDELKLAPLPVIGFSMGGWLAAEMAAMYPERIRRLVLVGAAGLKPEKGDIADIFLMTPEEVRLRQFYDPAQVPEYEQLYGGEPTLKQRQTAMWDREMAALLTWKPYMYNPKLPFLLRSLDMPTQIVWGRHDAIVPLNCGDLYQAVIPGAQLTVIEACGHSPQLEKPQEFLDAVLPFLTAS